MSKKKKALIAVFAIFAVAIIGLGVGVVAKYVSTINKSGSASVAKWTFRTVNSAAELKCDPTKTYNEDTLVDGKIAPGTTGTCEIELSNEGGEVGVSYTITPAVSGKPTNLVLTMGGAAFNGTTPITGTLTPGETGKKISIDWEWPYNNTDENNAIDTSEGEAAGTMSITFSIVGEQVEPTE